MIPTQTAPVASRPPGFNISQQYVTNFSGLYHDCESFTMLQLRRGGFDC